MYLQQAIYQELNMQNDTEQLILLKKYKVLEKIGSGSFGSIYKCVNLLNKQQYAVKIEKKGKGDGQLQYQIKLYQVFQGINGVCKLYDYGVENEKLFMVIDLLFHSLQDLFQLCQKRFSVVTAINIGIQIITRLQSLHRKGFVHRDIKANNFMIGKKDKIKMIYVIDFGLAKRYKDTKTGQHIQIKSGKSLVGTARYASIASHDGFQQCRRDDLQSLGFLLLYFIRGKLPWQGIQTQTKAQKYAQIGKMKKQTSIQKICQQINEKACVFVKYFQYVRSLAFEQEPNYDLLRKILKQQLIKNKQQNKPLDWQSYFLKSDEKEIVHKKEKQKEKQKFKKR